MRRLIACLNAREWERENESIFFVISFRNWVSDKNYSYDPTNHCQLDEPMNCFNFAFHLKACTWCALKCNWIQASTDYMRHRALKSKNKFRKMFPCGMCMTSCLWHCTQIRVDLQVIHRLLIHRLQQQRRIFVMITSYENSNQQNINSKLLPKEKKMKNEKSDRPGVMFGQKLVGFLSIDLRLFC